MDIKTRLVHTGVRSDKVTGSVSCPVYQVATFQHPAFGESTGFDYSRTINPTRKVLEEAIARLEGGCSGFAFSSGMAAITTVLALFKTGDRIIVSDDLYGAPMAFLIRSYPATASSQITSIPAISMPLLEELLQQPERFS